MLLHINIKHYCYCFAKLDNFFWCVFACVSKVSFRRHFDFVKSILWGIFVLIVGDILNFSGRSSHAVITRVGKNGFCRYYIFFVLVTKSCECVRSFFIVLVTIRVRKLMIFLNAIAFTIQVHHNNLWIYFMF